MLPQSGGADKLGTWRFVAVMERGIGGRGTTLRWEDWPLLVFHLRGSRQAAIENVRIESGREANEYVVNTLGHSISAVPADQIVDSREDATDSGAGDWSTDQWQCRTVMQEAEHCRCDGASNKGRNGLIEDDDVGPWLIVRKGVTLCTRVAVR